MRYAVSHFILTFALFISLSLVLSSFYLVASPQRCLEFVVDEISNLILTAVWDAITCIDHVESPSYLSVQVFLPIDVEDFSLRIDESGCLFIFLDGHVFSFKLPSRSDIVYVPSSVFISKNFLRVEVWSDGKFIYVKLS